jgi:hypothetical protein
LKITAWLITAEEVEKEEKRQREVKENTFFDYDWD